MFNWFAQLMINRPGKVVAVKSWTHISYGPYGIEWPMILVDEGGRRSTVVPCWNKAQFKAFWNHLKGRR